MKSKAFLLCNLIIMGAISISLEPSNLFCTVFQFYRLALQVRILIVEGVFKFGIGAFDLRADGLIGTLQFDARITYIGKTSLRFI